MPDDVTPPAEPDAGENPTPPDGENPKTYSEEDFNRLKKAHDFFAGKSRTLESQIAELNVKLEEATKTKPDTKPDKNALDNALGKIKELEGTVTQLQADKRNYTVKSAVREKIGSKLADGLFDMFWAAEGDKFDEVEDGAGGKKIGLKDRPYVELEDYVNELPASLRKSSAQPGGGVPKAGGEKGDHGITLESLKRMSNLERIQALAKHPELRKPYAESVAAGH